ncbi:hypothetical protein J5N97_012322 [Dioscorea zingiberensis]|uniref:GATA-type domain-containing protein n=1 Tax=Dioscorea zingiberensis TaxID=325984 RepID=A0A9D5HHQ3_9LILI|nr:hypothetical protein J5N97_012322 [Dioscorea zingiberensis]
MANFPLSQLSTIDLPDIEEDDFSMEDFSSLQNIDDPLNCLDWHLNAEVFDGLEDFINLPLDDSTLGLTRVEHHTRKTGSTKVEPCPTTSSVDPDGASCVTNGSGNQNSYMELDHKPEEVIEGISNSSMELPRRKHETKKRLGARGLSTKGQRKQRQMVNLDVSWPKKKRNTSSQKRRIWSVEPPVWLLNNALTEGNEKLTKDETNEVQVNVSKIDHGETISHSCSYCGTKETPQWRRGPKGPSTLCNACGIRYRTGNMELRRRHSNKKRKYHRNQHQIEG